MIDFKNIKQGDWVGVVVRDVSVAGRSVSIRANGEFEHAWIPDHAIVSHTPAPKPALKVGDRVNEVVEGYGRERVVMGIIGQWVYLTPVVACGISAPAHDLSEVEQWERV